MCHCIIEVKYNLDKEPAILKKIDSKDDLAKELLQLERVGTVASVTVYLNHHKHRLVSSWVDELYKEPISDVVTV